MMLPSKGVQIRLADGGYIVSWKEHCKPKPDEAGGDSQSYLERENRGLPSVHLHGQGFMPLRFKCAVRVKLGDALKLAGEVLSRLEEDGEDDDGLGGGSYLAGHDDS